MPTAPVIPPRRPNHKYRFRPELSRREAEILKLIADGNMNKDIAKILGLSVKTIEAHRDRIYKKSGIENAVQATHLGIHLGLSPVIEFPAVTIKKN